MNIEFNREANLSKRPKKAGSMTRALMREKIDGWLFCLPFVISVLVFIIGPLICAFILSFKEYSFLDNTSMFAAKNVGIRNYFEVFKDKTFIKALWNTARYSMVVVPTQIVIALLLALVVDSNVRGKSFFRTAYYIPTITSTVAVAIIFLFLFKADGPVNGFLKLIGLEPRNWFYDLKLILPMIMSMAIWSSVGLYMVIFLAGLQDIPSSLYEAARIDGANGTQEFFNITLPLLKPTVFFNLVVSLIGTFLVFDQAYIVSKGDGGPLDSTMTVVLYIYRQGFREFKMGYACSIAFVLFVIIFIITMIQKALFGEETRM